MLKDHERNLNWVLMFVCFKTYICSFKCVLASSYAKDVQGGGLYCFNDAGSYTLFWRIYGDSLSSYHFLQPQLSSET